MDKEELKTIAEKIVEIAQRAIEMLFDDPRWDYETSEHQEEVVKLEEDLNKLIDTLNE